MAEETTDKTLSSESVPHDTIEPANATGPSPALAKAPEAVRRSMPLALSITIGILLAAFLSWFFYELTWFILLFYLSFVMATVLEAPVHYLKTKGIPRTLSTVLILFGGLLILAGITYLLARSLNSQITTMADEMAKVPARLNAMVETLKSRFPGLGQFIGEFDAAAKIRELAPSAAAVGTQMMAGFEAITYLVVAFFTIMYMVIEGPTHLTNMRRLLPKHARLEATKLFHEMAKTHRGWFLASVGNVASSTVLTSIGLWLLGIPGAFVLGCIAGLGELIPNVGPALFAIPAVVLTFLIKPAAIGWVLLMFLIVQTVQSYTISPLMMKIGVELPVLVTIISVLVMGYLFGLLGVFVAIPLVADMVVVWNYLNNVLDKDTNDYDQVNPHPDAVRLPAGPVTKEGSKRQRRRFFFRRFGPAGAAPLAPTPPPPNAPPEARADGHPPRSEAPRADRAARTPKP